jgi:hypothetical protein
MFLSMWILNDKRMMRVLCLVIILTFSSCYQKDSHTLFDQKDPIHIYINTTIKEDIKASDLFKKITYIPLKLPEKIVFGGIDKLVVTDSHYIVGDFYNSQKILVFDQAGKFLSQIFRLGEGPGEYLQLTDFSVIESEALISILSPTKLLFFDFEGNFIHETKLSIKGVYKSQSLKDDTHLYYIPGNMAKSLVDERFNEFILFLDEAGEITPLVRTVEIYEHVPFFSERDNLKINYNEIIFSFNFSDTIFLLNKEEIQAKFVLDFGKEKFPVRIFQEQNHDDILNNPELQEKYAIHFPNLHYEYPWLITKYRKSNWVTVFFNRDLDKSFVFYTMINNLDNGLDYLNIKYLKGKKIYGVHRAEELISLPNSGTLGIENIDPESHVLLIYELLDI